MMKYLFGILSALVVSMGLFATEAKAGQNVQITGHVCLYYYTEGGPQTNLAHPVYISVKVIYTDTNGNQQMEVPYTHTSTIGDFGFLYQTAHNIKAGTSIELVTYLEPVNPSNLYGGDWFSAVQSNTYVDASDDDHHGNWIAPMLYPILTPQ
jgi:hypothetical protein